MNILSHCKLCNYFIYLEKKKGDHIKNKIHNIMFSCVYSSIKLNNGVCNLWEKPLYLRLTSCILGKS